MWYWVIKSDKDIKHMGLRELEKAVSWKEIDPTCSACRANENEWHSVAKLLAEDLAKYPDSVAGDSPRSHPPSLPSSNQLSENSGTSLGNSLLSEILSVQKEQVMLLKRVRWAILSVGVVILLQLLHIRGCMPTNH
jgi:hypothetical protein